LEYIDLFLIHTPWGYRNGNVAQNDYRIQTETDKYGNAIFDDYSHTEMWYESELSKWGSRMWFREKKIISSFSKSLSKTFKNIFIRFCFCCRIR